WFAAGIKRRVHGVSARQCCAVGSSNHLIVELHSDRRHDGGGRHNLELIVVPRRLAIFAVGFDDRQRKAVRFHLTIAPPGEAQQVGASDFEPHEVVRVVDDSHLIGFSVPNTNPADCATAVHRVGATERACIARALSSRVARSGSEAPKIAWPATRIRAPAATTRGAVFRSMPPSISMGAAVFPARSSAARTSRTLASLLGMKLWPPKPGLTDMTSTKSTSPAI